MDFENQKNVKSSKNKTKINKKRFILAIVISILIIFVVVLGIVKIVSLINTDKKDQLTIYLEEMGKDFYENFYYDEIGTTQDEKTDFLSKYDKMGITVSLDTLSKYKNSKNKEIADKFVNSKTKQACDRDKTKVMIYPKGPYKRDSYEMKVIVDCGN